MTDGQTGWAQEDFVKLDVAAKELPTTIPAARLHEIVRHLLSYGYGLDGNDPRMAQCLAWDATSVPLLRS